MDIEKSNILYLDTDSVSCDAFVNDFKANYAIFVANSIEKALEIIKEQHINIAIVDQNLDDTPGIRFFETIRDEYPNIIRMLVSSSKDPNTLIEAINTGQIFRYITKPWDKTELQQSIDLGLKIYWLEKKNIESLKKMQEESLKIQRILKVFRKYVPGLVLDELATKNEPMFGGEVRNVTILFASVDGLTQLIKTVNPPQILYFLNEYFAIISDAIIEHRGTIDKFIGGRALAIFGAPITYLNSEKNAVFCALALKQKLNKFNQEFSQKIGFETNISIGINSGPAVVGNIGSEQYISYTAIGSSVNIASRIADIAYKEPGSILIGESVYQAIQNDFTTANIGKKEIRGKDEPIDIYQVIEKKH